MLENLLKRRDDEEGFTLIELMVVVLIIGILVAIAVPTFLNAQNNAKSKAAQSNARSALSASKTVYADKETYDTFAKADLTSAEPSLQWQDEGAASGSVEQVSWDAAGNVMRIAVLSKSGECFFIRDDVTAGTGGTQFGKDSKAVTTAAGGCLATTTPSTKVYSLTQAAGWAS